MTTKTMTLRDFAMSHGFIEPGDPEDGSNFMATLCYRIMLRVIALENCPGVAADVDENALRVARAADFLNLDFMSKVPMQQFYNLSEAEAAEAQRIMLERMTTAAKERASNP